MQRTRLSAAILSLSALIAAPSTILAAPAHKATAETPATTQLPRHARPTHYALWLKPDAQAATFEGKVVISLDLLASARTITLHAVDLAFDGARIAAGPGRPAQEAALDALAIRVNGDKQTATLTFAQALPKGSYQLEIRYRGKIGAQAAGLFSLDYGRQRALYTQFESADARRMFPSWDEPAFRTTYALEAEVPASQMAVSNMPVASSTDLGNGNKLVRFATTPSMSSYLLFFGMGDFERASAREGQTELGVVTVRGRLPQAQFVLDSSAAVLRYFNNYFGSPYPLPKLDNVAAPGRSQFFGAMENWGAIMSFESVMLLDPAIASQYNRQEAFATAAHETAHQWFGNLVTMRWWDDLWLNEGFATWMEGRTTERLHPEWETTLGTVAEREHAIERDALASTHPVVQHVRTVEEAHSAFDEITYAKGGAVIRMLENYVGEAAWRNGVRSYLKEYAYGNAVSGQLWRHVERAAAKPVTAIAHDFTLQPGVPLIRVGAYACQGGQTRVALTQGEYSKDKPNKKALSWRVPVLAQVLGGAGGVGTVGENPVGQVLVKSGKASLNLDGCGPVVVNAGQAGYYRTLYAPKAYAALADQFGQMATIDQLGLLSDVWALGMTGLQPASDLMALIAATPDQAAPQVWGRITGSLENLRFYFRTDAARRARLSAFAINRLAPVLARIGWDRAAGEAAPVAVLREQLITTLGALGDAAVVAEARRRYHAASAGDSKALAPELRRPVLNVVARHADAATWDQLHATAQAEQSSILKAELYELLGQPEDPVLAQRALELAISGEPEATTSSGIIDAVADEHSDLAFDFAVAHLAQVNTLLEASARADWYARIGGKSMDAAMPRKLRAWAAANVTASAQGPVLTAISRVDYRVKLVRERLPHIAAWLERQP